ncbi:hypothetical protein ACIA5A_05935 [Micromonospora sp. NPDC051300]|uniref:hypothetical protein n=1 Tax=Micromonospora sp. NPDC051300 TaxID=3364286 RepID=UPI0037B78009
MNRTLAPLGLPRDRDGYQYGTAGQLAALLTSPERPITDARIRDWARRSRKPADRLYGLLPAIHTPGPRTGNSYYRVVDAATVELVTRPQQAVR